MRFTDTTRKIITMLWINGTSMENIAACYTTTPEAVEHMIRVQLASEKGITKKVSK